KTKDNWNCFNHIIWRNVLYYTAIHIAAIYGGYLVFTSAKILTTLFAIFLYHISIFGVTAGIHRLWSHRAYKASLPLRIILGIFSTIAYQGTIYEWAREHRAHHKYSETDADCVNSKRGFFFAHCGWLMCAPHPAVADHGDKIDSSDMLADPVVAIQRRHYKPAAIILCFVMPSVVPMYLWSETFCNAFFVCVWLRYILALNACWLVNSVAHMWGYKPYDVSIGPTDNSPISALVLGEGFHNFHHTFPWDYSTSEWGWKCNVTTLILDQLATIGWVYDRRYATRDLIEKRKTRTGPKAHTFIHQDIGVIWNC
ncbi:unnamed protein product, partial [Medioppia subpectinata]